jgi:hypothetical protein
MDADTSKRFRAYRKGEHAPACRLASEVQQAHDRIIAILAGEVPNPFEGDIETTLIASADVLCWVLNHEHNRNFGKNLAAIDNYLAGQGYEFRGLA